MRSSPSKFDLSNKLVSWVPMSDEDIVVSAELKAVPLDKMNRLAVQFPDIELFELIESKMKN